MSDIYNITLKRNEHHSVTSTFTYQIPLDDILEEFGTKENFEKAVHQSYGDDDYDSSLDNKFTEFVDNYDYEREDDWWTDRKGGYDVDYEIEE